MARLQHCSVPWNSDMRARDNFAQVYFSHIHQSRHVIHLWKLSPFLYHSAVSDSILNTSKQHVKLGGKWTETTSLINCPKLGWYSEMNTATLYQLEGLCLSYVSSLIMLCWPLTNIKKTLVLSMNMQTISTISIKLNNFQENAAQFAN